MRDRRRFACDGQLRQIGRRIKAGGFHAAEAHVTQDARQVRTVVHRRRLQDMALAVLMTQVRKSTQLCLSTEFHDVRHVMEDRCNDDTRHESGEEPGGEAPSSCTS